MQKGLLRAVLHVCRLLSSTAQSVEAKAAAASSLPALDSLGSKPEPGPPSAPLPVGPQVALKQDISQAVYGTDPRPEEECTGEQLTGVDFLLKRDCAPYVDFGVWGPDRHRLLEKLRTTGLQLHASGVLKNIELSGPPDVETLPESF